MPKRILGIDIGSHSVKLVQLQGTLKGYVVSSLLEHRWERESTAPPSTTEISTTLKALLAREKIKPETIISAIPAQSAILRILVLPFRDQKKIREVVRYELEPHIPSPVEEMLIDFLPLERQAKETKILVAAIQKDVMARHLTMLQEAGIDPAIVDLELFADINTYFSLYKPRAEAVVSLINVGASKTTLKVLQGTQLLLARSIPKGGNFITEVLQKERHLSFAEAEQQKITAGETPEIFPLVRSALSSLVKDIEHTLFSYTAKMDESSDIEEIILSGGGANTPGITAYLSQHFDIPVRRIGTEERLSLLLTQTPPLSSSFTVGLGLGIRGLSRSMAVGMNFRQEEFSFHKSYEEIKGKLIFVGVALCLALVLTLGNFYYRLAQKEGQYQQIQSQVYALFRQTFPDVRNVASPLQQAKQKIQEEENKLKAFGGITGAQLSSLELLRELSEKIPKTIKVDVLDLLISTESVSMSGQTNSFDSVDNLKKSLETSSYFESVKVTNAKVGLDENTVEFKLAITLKKI